MPLIRKPSSETPRTEAPAPSRAALTEGSGEERFAAARAFPTTPEGVALLSEALAKEPDPRVRGAIFTRLACAATAASVEAVLPYLRSDDAQLRTGALDALRAMPEAAEPCLALLLADADPDVRLLACEILRGLADARATTLLCALLERESEANVCAAAVDVLAEIGTPEAVPALKRTGDRFASDPFLGFAIRITIERIGAPTGPARKPRT